MQSAYFQEILALVKKSAFLIMLILFLMTIPMVAFAQNRGGGGGNGGGGNGGGGNGGGGGDFWIPIASYTAAACPISDAVRADYINISACTLAKRSRDLNNFQILVSGYTNLPPLTRDVPGGNQFALPCGNIAIVPGFTEVAFVQLSPAPPPIRLDVISFKIRDTCPH